MSRTSRARSGSRWIASVSAVLVGVAVAAGAWFAVLSGPQGHRASAYVVVVPTGSSSLDQAAGLYDSLSKGQVVATAATILARPWWAPGATDATITAGEVTPSSVIKITVTSQDPAIAQDTLAQAVARSSATVDAAITPFVLKPLPSGATAPERIGLGASVRVGLAGLAGLLAGGLTWYAAGLVVARRHDRR